MRNPATAPRRVQTEKVGQINAGMDLLPFCTTKGQLDGEQIIALSDVAGSLREVVLLALGEPLAEDGGDVLAEALGQEGAEGVREFFAEEWVADV